MLTRRTISTLWCREKWLFTPADGSVALVGHGSLKLLIALDCAATIANVLQAVATLQLNFVANGRLTWRRQIAGGGTSRWRRWGRFHLARGASLLVCIALFPGGGPPPATSAASGSLLAVAGVVNFGSDNDWSFAARSRLRLRHAAGRSVT